MQSKAGQSAHGSECTIVGNISCKSEDNLWYSVVNHVIASRATTFNVRQDDGMGALPHYGRFVPLYCNTNLKCLSFRSK